MWRVLSPGLLTTVQDLGRPGYGSIGVPPSGALDEEALARANLLVGNHPGDAALELTFQGPVLQVEEATRAAVAGGSFGPAPGRVVHLSPGDVLDLSRSADGSPRAVLAVAGGLDVPPVMGSRSTCLPGCFGGLGGRRLLRGDVLPVGRAGAPGKPASAVSLTLPNPGKPASAVSLTLPEPAPDPTPLRVLAGPHLPAALADSLFDTSFVLRPESNRTGFRLSGELRLPDDQVLRMASYPTVTGTIQLTAAGQLLVLLADRPTTGGYPWVATLLRADVPSLVRLAPGRRVRLVPVSLGEARRLLALREERMRRWEAT